MNNYQISEIPTGMDGGVAALLLLCCLQTYPVKQADLHASDFCGAFYFTTCLQSEDFLEINSIIVFLSLYEIFIVVLDRKLQVKWKIRTQNDTELKTNTVEI